MQSIQSVDDFCHIFSNKEEFHFNYLMLIGQILQLEEDKENNQLDLLEVANASEKLTALREKITPMQDMVETISSSQTPYFPNLLEIQRRLNNYKTKLDHLGKRIDQLGNDEIKN